MTVTERATTHGYLSASPNTISFPSGLTAGDLLILVWGTDYRRNGGLSGWTIVLDTYPNYANGGLAWKIATSGDVSAGSVSMPMTGLANGSYACIAIQAGTFSTTDPIRLGGQRVSTAANSTLPITPATTVTTASSRIYYFGYRSALQTLTCSVGTQQWTQNGTANAYNAAGSLYAEDITSSVTRAPAWTASPTVAALDGSAFITFEVCVAYAGSGFNAEINQSLQGWWKLDETSGTTANDSSGNNRHMTYGAGAVLAEATVRPGGVRAAKATTGHVASIASATWMDRSAFTATVWAKLAAPTGSNKGFFSRYNSGAAQGAWLIWENTASAPTAEAISSGVITSTGIPIVDSPVVAVTNDVHFIALTYNSSTICLYVDGHLMGQLASSATTAAISQEMTLGAYNNSGTSPALATLQDATFHSAALTDAQIWAIWASRSVAAPTSPTVGYGSLPV